MVSRVSHRRSHEVHIVYVHKTTLVTSRPDPFVSLGHACMRVCIKIFRFMNIKCVNDFSSTRHPSHLPPLTPPFRIRQYDLVHSLHLPTQSTAYPLTHSLTHSVSQSVSHHSLTHSLYSITTCFFFTKLPLINIGLRELLSLSMSFSLSWD